MDKCPKCGAEAYGFIDASGAGIYKCGSTDHGFDPEHPEPFVSVFCLKRQIAAANERVAKLEAAEHRMAERIDYYERTRRCHSPYAKRPILYTDTVNGEQCCVDNLWAVSTEELNAANERAGRLEELRKDAWAMLLAIASGNGPFEKKMTRADMMEAARQAAESLEVPDAL